MTHEGLKYDKINIELRRSKVLELLAKGQQQQEIAKSSDGRVHDIAALSRY